MSGSFSGGRGAYGPELEMALARLDGLVDWERRARSDASGRLMRQSLAPARDLLERLGSPDARLTTILVAGTKGKGSVASLLANALHAQGHAVGVYASPHVERVNERIRLFQAEAQGGTEIEDRALALALESAMQAREAAIQAQAPGKDATWFDVFTAAAIWSMERAGMRFACLECGLGGRLDSTNATQPVLSILTQVELEHTAILGQTRAAIAREKAAIGRPGRPLISGAGGLEDEAGAAAAELAGEIGARWLAVDLSGCATIEERNVRLAQVALAELGRQTGLPQLEMGALEASVIEAARLPGRMEWRRARNKLVVLDGAHVPGSLRRVLSDLEGRLGTLRQPLVVFGAGADKDLPAMLKVLIGRVDRLFCTSPGLGPYVAPLEMELQALSLGLAAQAIEDPERAFEEALQHCGEDQWVLITGSLHLVGRLRRLVDQP